MKQVVTEKKSHQKLNASFSNYTQTVETRE